MESVQQAIINSYELDFAKHAPTKDFPKLTAIWRSIPEQLAKLIFDRCGKKVNGSDEMPYIDYPAEYWK